jgi:hypothetical protein
MNTLTVDNPPPTASFEKLYDRYCTWIDTVRDIRERMEALREESRAFLWKPSPELTERLDDLNERDMLYAARHRDTARAFLEAAESDVAATRPQRLAQIEAMKETLKALRHAWENGWEHNDFSWTPEERLEFKWLVYCNPELKSLRRISQQNTIYFCQKAMAFQKARNEAILHRSLHQKPRLKLGLNLIGRKGRK